MSTADQILELIGQPGAGELAVSPPGEGAGYWAGGPSTIWTDDAFWLAYRLRRPVDKGRGYANVVARSADGVHFETVATVTAEQFGSASLERPALVRTDGRRLAALRELLDVELEALVGRVARRRRRRRAGRRRNARVVLPGDDDTAWKDIVVEHDEAAGEWHLWACRHPLDGGDDEADRMTTWYASSPDGSTWTMQGQALGPTPGAWDARGARVTSVLETGRRVHRVLRRAGDLDRELVRAHRLCARRRAERVHPGRWPDAGRPHGALPQRRAAARRLPVLLGGGAGRRRQRTAHRVRAPPGVAQPVLKRLAEQVLEQCDVVAEVRDQLATVTHRQLRPVRPAAAQRTRAVAARASARARGGAYEPR